MKTLQGKGIVEGIGKGPAIVSEKPFGFFGGVNPKTGEIIDKWHELYGQSIKGKVFVYPEGRGSTVGAAIIWNWQGLGVHQQPLLIKILKS